MECLIRKNDNTLAYIHKMHKYNPKVGTPRPKPKKIPSKKDSHEQQQYLEILQFFYNI